MPKVKVLRKIGRSVVDVGVQEIEDINFARQLVEKGLAVLVEGEIPKKETRKKEDLKKKTPSKKKG